MFEQHDNQLDFLSCSFCRLVHLQVCTTLALPCLWTFTGLMYEHHDVVEPTGTSFATNLVHCDMWSYSILVDVLIALPSSNPVCLNRSSMHEVQSSI